MCSAQMFVMWGFKRWEVLGGVLFKTQRVLDNTM